MGAKDKDMTATARRRQNREGVSIFRIALIIGIVGLVLIAVWAIWFFVFDQSSRRVPFEVTLYPTSEFWGESDVQVGYRNLFYRTTDSPEVVVNFYQDKLNEHYGNRDQSCVRIPPTGSNPRSEQDPTLLQYEYKCVFDRSGFNQTQYTQVLIYPGAYNADPFLNAQGLTVIQYEQQWQP
jgi:hypothetical protein